jgi:hypothetical protein
MTFAQKGFLYVKKKGFKKVSTFQEGSIIKFETKEQQVVYGIMTLVKKDSILVNAQWFKASSIVKIFLREKTVEFPTTTFLWTTLGVGISTGGMTLAKWTSFRKALAYSAGIGYGNFLIQFFPKFRRKKYRIGKKFTLQTFDLHF